MGKEELNWMKNEIEKTLKELKKNPFNPNDEKKAVEYLFSSVRKTQSITKKDLKSFIPMLIDKYGENRVLDYYNQLEN